MHVTQQLWPGNEKTFQYHLDCLISTNWKPVSTKLYRNEIGIYQSFWQDLHREDIFSQLYQTKDTSPFKASKWLPFHKKAYGEYLGELGSAGFALRESLAFVTKDSTPEDDTLRMFQTYIHQDGRQIKLFLPKGVPVESVKRTKTTK